MRQGTARGGAFLTWAVILTMSLTACIPFSQSADASDSLPSASSWNISVVDPSSGWHSSITVDSAGRPHIVYLGGTDELRYAWFDGFSWRFERVDAWTEQGYKASLAIDSSDIPHIAYFDKAFMDLKYATRINGTWNVEVVDEYGEVGRQPSIALDSHDRPHISYYYVPDLPIFVSIKYAVRNGTSWEIENVTDTVTYDIGDADTSLVLNSTNIPRIAFGADQIIYYAYKETSAWKIEPIYGNPGDNRDNHYPSMALDSNEIPHIVYSRSSTADILEHAQRTPMGWVVGDVDPAGGYYHSIAMDSTDRANIAYTNSLIGPTPFYLYYAYHDTSWITEIVDTQESVRGSLSIAIDGCDGIHISYTRELSGVVELRYAYLPGQDATPPATFASSSGPYWRNVSPIAVGATVSDSCSGVANVTLWYRHSRDNATTWGAWTQFSTLPSPLWSWSFTFPEGEGYYEFYTTAVDNVGNAEPPPPVADAIAGYDITPPVSTALPIFPYWHTTPPLVVNATATDNLSGVTYVMLYYSHAPLDNSTWSPWISIGTKTFPPWSWPFSFPDSEGHYKFHTLARDVAGNVEGGKAYAEAIAGYRIPPDYTPVNPLPSSSLTVGLSLSVQLSIEVLNTGGFENVTSILAFYNESPPSSPFLVAEVPPIPAGNASGPFTASWTSPAIPCACRVVVDVDYRDNLSELNETNNNYTWTVNVVPGPITSLVIGQPNYTATDTYVTSQTPLTLTAFDQSGTGILRTMYSIDGNPWLDYSVTGQITLLGEGNHTVRYYSEDNAGNVETARTATLRVDDTPPSSIFEIGVPSYLVGGNFTKFSAPLTIQAVDGGMFPVGLESVMFRVWSGIWSSWSAYTSQFTLSGQDGYRHIEYYSTDLLGNMEDTHNATVIIDNTPPSLSIQPEQAAVSVDTHFTLSAVDGQGCGVAVLEYSVDGGPWTTYSSPFTLPEGLHTIGYRSWDHLNNSVERTHSVEVVGPETPPGVEAETNYKPLVAAVFAIILSLVGLWSSRRRPWKGGTGRKAILKAFVSTSVPFVLAEAVTGILSLFFEPLRIPPLIGWGTGVDCAILTAGLLLLFSRLARLGGREAENPQREP